MDNGITVSASIVTYNCLTQVKDAIKSITEKTKKYPFKLYVFDNNSFDGTKEYIENTYKDVTVKNVGYNSGFGHAHNLSLKEDLGKYHAVINPDITVDSDVIAELVDVMEKNPEIVMATPKILFPDGSEQKLPKRNPSFKYVFLGRLASLGGIFKKIREEYTRANETFETVSDVDFCTGCFFVIRTSVFKELCGFDERFFMYFEDNDLSRRAKKKGKIVFCPESHVFHFWNRASAKSFKYFFIHLKSYFIYRHKWRKSK